jgi:hypothetical protein
VWKNLTLLGAALVVAVAAGEAVTRVALGGITTTTDNRSYFAMKWKREQVRLNSLGFREREFTAARQPGGYRIAVIGDSFAFGQGISESERMSNLLEAELRRHRDGVEVLNFSAAGMNSDDELALMRKVLATATPDFVLLQWYVNDVEIRSSSASPRPAPTGLRALRRRVHNTSALYFVASTSFHRLLGRGRADYIDRLIAQFGDAETPQSRRATALLEEFFGVCRENGIGCGMVLVPHILPQSVETYPLAFLHDRILDTCRRQAATCVDLRVPFGPYWNEQSYRTLWVNRFDYHMSPFANRLAVAALLDAYRPVWAGGRSASARVPVPES